MELDLSLSVVVVGVNVLNLDQRRSVLDDFGDFAETLSIDSVEDLSVEEL